MNLTKQQAKQELQKLVDLFWDKDK